MPEITLETLMDVAYQAGLAVASHEELKSPMLSYVRPDGTVGCATLVVPEVHPSVVAKVVLAAERATMAALCFESWKVDVLATDEMRADLEAGRTPDLGIAPKDHPDRYDALVLLGEVRGQPQTQRHWRIRTDPAQGQRTFEEETVPEGSPQPSRFTPLFVSDREARELVYGYIEQFRLRNQSEAGRN